MGQAPVADDPGGPIIDAFRTIAVFIAARQEAGDPNATAMQQGMQQVVQAMQQSSQQAAQGVQGPMPQPQGQMPQPQPQPQEPMPQAPAQAGPAPVPMGMAEGAKAVPAQRGRAAQPQKAVPVT